MLVQMLTGQFADSRSVKRLNGQLAEWTIRELINSVDSEFFNNHMWNNYILQIFRQKFRRVDQSSKCPVRESNLDL